MTDYKKWSLQKIFNKVAGHLVKQGKRAVNFKGECVLFDADTGMRCAYGCLVPKKEFKNYHYDVVFDEISRAFPYYSNQRELMDCLMVCHDDIKPSRWKSRLRAIARRFSLEIPPFLKDDK